MTAPKKQGVEPVEIDVYAVFTSNPNAVVQPVHRNRMPVMLSGEAQFCKKEVN